MTASDELRRRADKVESLTRYTSLSATIERLNYEAAELRALADLVEKSIRYQRASEGLPADAHTFNDWSEWVDALEAVERAFTKEGE